MKSDFDSKKVGERLKQLREKKRETQKELSDIFGISQKAVSNYEKGITPLPIEMQALYAEHYNVSHDYFFTGNSNDSILELLKKYVTLKYNNLNEGETFHYPTLQIDKVFFNYLIEFANVEYNKTIPDDIREIWSKRVTDNFYERNKNNEHKEFETVVPLPKELLYPDDSKNAWKQRDLIREMDNEFQKKLKNV